MRVVILKDCAHGRAGQRVTVSVKQGAILIRKGYARAESFRDEVVTK